MSKWLPALFGNTTGHVDLARRDLSELITEGADMIIKQRRTNLFPRFHHDVPQGVAIVNDEDALELYIAGIVSKLVRLAEWQAQRFAYPAKEVGYLERSRAWVALERGLNRHDCHPILTTERDLFCFNGQDWHICKLQIGIGLG